MMNMYVIKICKQRLRKCMLKQKGERETQGPDRMNEKEEPLP